MYDSQSTKYIESILFLKYDYLRILNLYMYGDTQNCLEFEGMIARLFVWVIYTLFLKITTKLCKITTRESARIAINWWTHLEIYSYLLWIVNGRFVCQQMPSQIGVRECKRAFSLREIRGYCQTKSNQSVGVFFLGLFFFTNQ